MRRIIAILPVALACILLVQGAVQAASDAEKVTVTIGEIFCMEMHPHGCLNWTSGHYIPTCKDYDAHTTFPDHPQGWTRYERYKLLFVTANTPWEITVEGTSPTFDVDDGLFPGAWTEKPVGDIVWAQGVTHFSHLTLDPEVVAEGNPCEIDYVWVRFKILLDWCDDTPGEYSYQYVVLTLGAQ